MFRINLYNYKNKNEWRKCENLLINFQTSNLFMETICEKSNLQIQFIKNIFFFSRQNMIHHYIYKI